MSGNAWSGGGDSSFFATVFLLGRPDCSRRHCLRCHGHAGPDVPKLSQRWKSYWLGFYCANGYHLLR